MASGFSAAGTLRQHTSTGGVIMSNSEISVAEAMEVISEALKNDEEYAIVWHANVSMLLYDAGVNPVEANDRAGRFMNSAFGINTNNWKEKGV